MRGFVVCFFLLLGVGLAQAQSRNPGYGGPHDFLGTWHNVEIRKTQVIRIVITPEYGNLVTVRVYGLCRGEPCTFGEERGHLLEIYEPLLLQSCKLLVGCPLQNRAGKVDPRILLT